MTRGVSQVQRVALGRSGTAGEQRFASARDPLMAGTSPAMTDGKAIQERGPPPFATRDLGPIPRPW